MHSLGKKNKSHHDVIGLVPAGGHAARLGPLPCSKEIFPIGFRRLHGDDSIHPKVAGHYLLEKMRIAGVKKTYIILRDGKWDIPAYFGDGNLLDMHLAYLMMRLPYGVPYTIDQAYPFCRNNIVAFGFPDIIFQQDDAFAQLLTCQSDSKADIVLGLFPVENTKKWDMVSLDCNSRIRKIVIKPEKTNLKYAWIIAIWTPTFTNFMHEYLGNTLRSKEKDSELKDKELYVGDVIQAALDNKIHVDNILFSDSICIDIGTPEDLSQALRT